MSRLWYNRRWMVETVSSSIKCTLGSAVRARAGTSNSGKWSSNAQSTIFVEQSDTQQINRCYSVSARWLSE